jgi:phage head maturation protease
MAKRKNEQPKVINKKERKPKKGSIQLLNDIPIYTENTNVEDMTKNNKIFYEKISRKAFTTVLKEEKEHLKELVETEYYPDKETGAVVSDVDLIKNHLNLVS